MKEVLFEIKSDFEMVEVVNSELSAHSRQTDSSLVAEQDVIIALMTGCLCSVQQEDKVTISIPILLPSLSCYVFHLISNGQS